MPERYNGPRSPLEQPPVIAAITRFITDRSEDTVRTTTLHQEVLTVLSSAEIAPLSSSWRLKTLERIREKFLRAPTSPILDIYGIRIIVDESNVTRTVEVIREHWPMPKEFPWEGANGNIKTTRSGGNEFSNPDLGYNTIRMNVMFDDDRIAEIQIATSEQDEQEQIIWKAYARNQKGI